LTPSIVRESRVP